MQPYQIHQLNQARQQNQQQAAATAASSLGPPATSTVPTGVTDEQQQHALALQVTEDHANEVRTIHNHSTRLNKIIDWISAHYPLEYENMVTPLTEEQKADSEKYWKATHGFIYENVDPNSIKRFISANKIKCYKDNEPVYYGFQIFASTKMLFYLEQTEQVPPYLLAFTFK
jgi:hypothetical protein